MPIADSKDPAPIDLIAWRQDDPRRWWLRRGTAVLLGEWAIELAEVYNEQIQVHRTPLDWLKGGGDGIVVLADWEAAYFRLRGLPIVAEDVRHGDELQRRLRLPEPELPRIFVRQALAA